MPRRSLRTLPSGPIDRSRLRHGGELVKRGLAGGFIGEDVKHTQGGPNPNYGGTPQEGTIPGASTGSQIGRASKIGFLAEKMIGGLAKKKKRMRTQPQGLSQQTLGQSPLSKDLIGR